MNQPGKKLLQNPTNTIHHLYLWRGLICIGNSSGYPAINIFPEIFCGLPLSIKLRSVVEVTIRINFNT